MKDGEILKKAYEQAEKFGFKWDGKYESFDKEDGIYMIHNNAWHVFPIETMLFSPEFAKALWGVKIEKPIGMNKEEFKNLGNTKGWQHHLQQLVILEKRADRIQYLQQFLK